MHKLQKGVKKGFKPTQGSQKVKVGFYIENYQAELIEDLAINKSKNQIVRDLLDIAFRKLDSKNREKSLGQDNE